MACGLLFHTVIHHEIRRHVSVLVAPFHRHRRDLVSDGHLVMASVIQTRGRVISGKLHEQELFIFVMALVRYLRDRQRMRF